MGTWGLQTFDDDHALDWLGDLRRSLDPGEIVLATAAIPHMDQDLTYGEAVSRQALGELVATLGGHPPPGEPELVELMAEGPTSMLCRAIGTIPASHAMLLVARIALHGEARIVAEESDCLESWLAVILDLLSRLDKVASATH